MLNYKTIVAEYRDMQKNRIQIANRDSLLTEKVNIELSNINKVVSDFNMDLKERVKSLKDAGATKNEIFNTIQKSLMAIGLNKQESALISKKLIK